jgi:hypothetical protein
MHAPAVRRGIAELIDNESFGAIDLSRLSYARGLNGLHPEIHALYEQLAALYHLIP